MASSIMAEIARDDLQGSTGSLASITNVEQLSSYNWIEAPTPTISVPGSPALWTPPKVSLPLPKDTGFRYIAQNTARHPTSPLEPLFRALYITNPTFDVNTIDVVTDRNNIRKLLTFVNPDSAKNGLEAFTINVEVTKNTTIFCRKETATSEVIAPHEFKGFGHEFEKAYTTDQIEGSTGHHRIISYDFGGLKFIVRYETDGYVKQEAKKTKSPSSDMPKTRNDISDLLDSMTISQKENFTPSIKDNISDLSSSLSIGKEAVTITTPIGSKMTIREEGKTIPLESTLEIKTRIVYKPLPISEVMPQLWVSQTPKLVRAYHKKGLFQKVKTEDMATEMMKWEEENKEHLVKLAVLIKKIIEVVKEGGGKAVVRCDVLEDKLVIVKAAAGEDDVLPKELYQKWIDEKGSEEDVGAGSDETLIQQVGGSTKTEAGDSDSPIEDIKSADSTTTAPEATPDESELAFL